MVFVSEPRTYHTVPQIEFAQLLRFSCKTKTIILRSSPHFHILKQSSNADFGMAFSSRVALLLIVLMSSNRFPLRAIFNFGSIQKSQGALSGLYGGWRSCTILCFAKNCCTRFDECVGSLSW